MVEFQVNSSMGDATASVKRQGKIEDITITKTLYEKEVSVRWMNSLKTAIRYKIIRTGHWNRNAEIRKGNKLLGSVKTNLGFSSTIQITNGNGTAFEIKENKHPLKREFEILKDGARIGTFHLNGIHFPLISHAGKGIHGYYNHLKPTEEELLVTSIIALGV